MVYKIIVIGTSRGGFQALQTVLSTLPAGFPLPIVIVMHREKGSGAELSQLLQQSCSLPVIEPEDKQPILPGFVYLAPADYHLLIETPPIPHFPDSPLSPSSLQPSVPSLQPSFALSTEATVRHARPCIDVLFESAAEVYGEKVIGVILTGTLTDGAKGLAAIKKAGGMAIVQDPETAKAKSMPEAAIAAVVDRKVDTILPIDGIGPFLSNFFSPQRHEDTETDFSIDISA